MSVNLRQIIGDLYPNKRIKILGCTFPFKYSENVSSLCRDILLYLRSRASFPGTRVNQSNCEFQSCYTVTCFVALLPCSGCVVNANNLCDMLCGYVTSFDEPS